ncbi:hypothetical protein E2C01_028574 [Portunus trituberculatus]|uniref:Uncharacterized protein n=1 Tax=Portunus trituberculatus TaxID=210409 RepID=A0A5B7EPG3_PORTR|nr:hypothetical protein [Portunus trituberculatus]
MVVHWCSHTQTSDSPLTKTHGGALVQPHLDYQYGDFSIEEIALNTLPTCSLSQMDSSVIASSDSVVGVVCVAVTNVVC